MTLHQARIGTGSYNGLSFGPGTKIHVAAWKRSVETATTDVPGSGDDGGFDGQDLATQQQIELTLSLIADDENDLASLIDSVSTAFTIQRTSRLPLLLFDGTRIINCRPLLPELPYDATAIRRTAEVPIRLRGTDPRMYDATLQTASTGLPAASGGFGFNFGFNTGFGGSGSGGLLSATNSGNYKTFPTFLIQGPADNPSIRNETTGQTLKFLLSLGSTSDVLTVDCLNRTVVLNGTASRNNTLAFGYDWIYYPPGTSSVRFNADNYSASALLTSQHRSAWL